MTPRASDTAGKQRLRVGIAGVAARTRLSWEFRVFDVRLDAVAERLRRHGPAAHRSRAVRYHLLPPARSVPEWSVVAHGAGIEAHSLVERRAGLDRWVGALRTAFPLTEDWIRRRLPVVLPGATPAPERPRYELGAFVAALSRWAPAVDVVRVREERSDYLWEDVQAEHVTARVAGRTLESVAISGPDAVAVGAAVAGLGLHIRANRSWAEVLGSVLRGTVAGASWRGNVAEP